MRCSVCTFTSRLVQADSVYLRDAWRDRRSAGSIGFFLNAWGPFRDGAWHKLARAVTWGVPAAALGGAVGLVLGEVVIGLFQGGLLGRALSWAVLGLGIGLGQGLADRSRQRLVYGLIGGGLGGFVGGYRFEALRMALGNRYDLSQALGIVILGAGLGLFLALVEQVLRRAWVRCISGRQEGRIYLLPHGLDRLGLDERAEVGIFGDPASPAATPRSRRPARATSSATWRPQAASRINGKPVTGTAAVERRRSDRAGPDPAGVPTEVGGAMARRPGHVNAHESTVGLEMSGAASAGATP